MATSGLPTFCWNTKIDARGEYADFAAAFHIVLDRDGLGYLRHESLVIERRIVLGAPPVLFGGKKKAYREEKKDFDARSDKVRIQKAAETDAFSKALAILLQLFDRKSGIYLSLVRVVKDTPNYLLRISRIALNISMPMLSPTKQTMLRNSIAHFVIFTIQMKKDGPFSQALSFDILKNSLFWGFNPPKVK